MQRFAPSCNMAGANATGAHFKLPSEQRRELIDRSAAAAADASAADAESKEQGEQQQPELEEVPDILEAQPHTEELVLPNEEEFGKYPSVKKLELRPRTYHMDVAEDQVHAMEVANKETQMTAQPSVLHDSGRRSTQPLHVSFPGPIVPGPSETSMKRTLVKFAVPLMGVTASELVEHMEWVAGGSSSSSICAKKKNVFQVTLQPDFIQQHMDPWSNSNKGSAAEAIVPFEQRKYHAVLLGARILDAHNNTECPFGVTLRVPNMDHDGVGDCWTSMSNAVGLLAAPGCADGYMMATIGPNHTGEITQADLAHVYAPQAKDVERLNCPMARRWMGVDADKEIAHAHDPEHPLFIKANPDPTQGRDWAGLFLPNPPGEENFVVPQSFAQYVLLAHSRQMYAVTHNLQARHPARRYGIFQVGIVDEDGNAHEGYIYPLDAFDEVVRLNAAQYNPSKLGGINLTSLQVEFRPERMQVLKESKNPNPVHLDVTVELIWATLDAPSLRVPADGSGVLAAIRACHACERKDAESTNEAVDKRWAARHTNKKKAGACDDSECNLSPPPPKATAVPKFNKTKCFPAAAAAPPNLAFQTKMHNAKIAAAAARSPPATQPHPASMMPTATAPSAIPTQWEVGRGPSWGYTGQQGVNLASFEDWGPPPADDGW